MRNIIETKTEDLAEKMIDTAKATIRLIEHTESLEKKKKWSGGDWVFLIFNSLNAFVSASKTIDSGKDLFDTISMIQKDVPSPRAIGDPLKLNLTPLQLWILSPPLYFLSSLPK